MIGLASIDHGWVSFLRESVKHSSSSAVEARRSKVHDASVCVVHELDRLAREREALTCRR
jgi:hypothetical protein